MIECFCVTGGFVLLVVMKFIGEKIMEKVNRCLVVVIYVEVFD